MKNNKRATIHDYTRFCKAHPKCSECPLHEMSLCNNTERNKYDIGKTNKIILDWCREHKTRQDRFLEMFPNAKIDNCGTSILCPRWVDKDFKCNRQLLCCAECCKEYWLAEVDNNESEI